MPSVEEAQITEVVIPNTALTIEYNDITVYYDSPELSGRGSGDFATGDNAIFFFQATPDQTDIWGTRILIIDEVLKSWNLALSSKVYQHTSASGLTSIQGIIINLPKEGPPKHIPIPEEEQIRDEETTQTASSGEVAPGESDFAKRLEDLLKRYNIPPEQTGNILSAFMGAEAQRGDREVMFGLFEGMMDSAQADRSAQAHQIQAMLTHLAKDRTATEQQLALMMVTMQNLIEQMSRTEPQARTGGIETRLDHYETSILLEAITVFPTDKQQKAIKILSYILEQPKSCEDQLRDLFIQMNDKVALKRYILRRGDDYKELQSQNVRQDSSEDIQRERQYAIISRVGNTLRKLLDFNVDH